MRFNIKNKFFGIITIIAITAFASLNCGGGGGGGSDRVYEIWDGTTAAEFAGGTGTASDPYLIENGEQLAYLANVINNNLPDADNGGSFNNSAKYYLLTEDIYLNNTKNWKNWGTTAPANSWTPIGDNNTASNISRFTAKFNGDGYAVYGIYINKTTNYQGLFGYLDTGGTVQNTGVEQSYIKGGYYVGGIAGYVVSSSIINCDNTGSIAGAQSVGGIAGQITANVSVTGCHNSGSVTGTVEDTGGIIGNAGSGSTIADCYNTGIVTGVKYTGGVCGEISNGTANESKISACYNTGSVKGTGESTGGIVGAVWTTGSSACFVSNCYNTGAVSGGTYYTGGVAGSISSNCHVTNCYNAGNVTAASYVGGVAGQVTGLGSAVTNCYNTGIVTENSSNTGSVAGQVTLDGKVNYGYYLTGTAINGYNAVAGGTATEICEFNTGGNFSGSKPTVNGSPRDTLLAALNAWVDNPTVTLPAGITCKTWTGTAYPVFSE